MPITVIERFIINQQPLIGSAPYDTAGVATIPLGYCPAGFNVEIERLAADAGTGATFTLYATDDSSSINVRERATVTVDPILVFDESSLIRFFPNEAIVAVFTGGTTGGAVVVAQALTVLYRPRVLPDETGPGTVVSRGLPDVGPLDAPDPGGWN